MTFIKIANARLFDPFTGEETISDIGVRDGRIFSLGHVEDSSADKVVDVGRRIVVPTLIDLHTHVYHLATSLGVNADRAAETSGVGVFVDAGSAGAGNFPGLLEYVIRASNCKIYSFLNIGFGGIPFFGIGANTQVGEIPDLQVADEGKCVECVRKNPDVIVGIKARLSALANGELGVKPLLAAKKCAREVKRPVMVHFGKPPPELEEILPVLELGDILTHTFRPRPNSIISESDWQVLSAVKEAKSRGILFDVGHGNSSFSFKVARAAIEQGVQPDTISTDIHTLSIEYPVGDLPTTMTKFLNLGMSLPAVLKSVTYTPAFAIKKLDLHGTIQPGMPADLTVLDIKERRRLLLDAEGEKIESKQVIEPQLRFVGGEPTTIDYIPPSNICHA
jgi:dihydroorotase